jgi:predicted nucleotidyltransferase
VHHAPVLSPRSFPGRDDGTDLQDPRRRAAVATVLCAALAASVPDSVASVRGSLATGNADPFSDIDLRWVVPDPAFAIAIERAWSTAETIGPLALGRLDPDLARSDRRRVLFLQYAHLPLFWRVDLEVRAASVAEADGYDDDNPAARAEHWSRPASALMNAVAALRAERAAVGRWRRTGSLPADSRASRDSRPRPARSNNAHRSLPPPAPPRSADSRRWLPVSMKSSAPLVRRRIRNHNFPSKRAAVTSESTLGSAQADLKQPKPSEASKLEILASPSLRERDPTGGRVRVCPASANRESLVVSARCGQPARSHCASKLLVP